jgi:hypothetical protein
MVTLDHDRAGFAAVTLAADDGEFWRDDRRDLLPYVRRARISYRPWYSPALPYWFVEGYVRDDDPTAPIVEYYWEPAQRRVPRAAVMLRSGLDHLATRDEIACVEAAFARYLRCDLWLTTVRVVVDVPYRPGRCEALRDHLAPSCYPRYIDGRESWQRPSEAQLCCAVEGDRRVVRLGLELHRAALERLGMRTVDDLRPVSWTAIVTRRWKFVTARDGRVPGLWGRRGSTVPARPAPPRDAPPVRWVVLPRPAAAIRRAVEHLDAALQQG